MNYKGTDWNKEQTQSCFDVIFSIFIAESADKVPELHRQRRWRNNKAFYKTGFLSRDLVKRYTLFNFFFSIILENLVRNFSSAKTAIQTANKLHSQMKWKVYSPCKVDVCSVLTDLPRSQRTGHPRPGMARIINNYSMSRRWIWYRLLHG